MACHHTGRELLSRRILPCSGGNVAVEVVDDEGVAVDDLVDGGGVDGVVEPGGGDGGDVDNVEFIGVGEQADEAHLVVGLVGDVGQDEEAGFVLVLGGFAETTTCLSSCSVMC